MPTPTPEESAIALFVRRLDRSVVEAFGSRRLRKYELTCASMNRDATNDPHLQRRVLRFANCVDYDILRTFTCIQMGISDEVFTSWEDSSFAAFLAVFATPAEMCAMRTCIRVDIGLAMMSVRECAQMHVWHGKSYADALSSQPFVEDVYHLARLTSGREAKWTELMHSTNIVLIQQKFATNILHITSIDVPNEAAGEKEWTDFVTTTATSIGIFMLTRLGHSEIKKSELQKTLDRHIRTTTVGEPVAGLLLAHIATANGMHPNVHAVDRLPYLWGMHCFYDMFFMDNRRRDVLCADKLIDSFASDYMAIVRQTFTAVKRTVNACGEESTADNLERRAIIMGKQLVDDEDFAKTRDKARTLKRSLKRREKKRRRRSKKHSSTKDEEEEDEEGVVFDNIVGATLVLDDIHYTDDFDDNCSLVVNVDEQDYMDDSDDELTFIFKKQTLSELFS